MATPQKGGSVDYGQSYTDPKTQRLMMKFLKKSNQFTGSSRLGRAKPKTQLNSDSKPKNDFYGNPRTLKATKGAPVGSEWQERLNNKPMPIKARYEKQDNKMGPKITSKRKPRVNKGGPNRKFK